MTRHNDAGLHTDDNGGNLRRWATIIIYLHDIPSATHGGETVFPPVDEVSARDARSLTAAGYKSTSAAIDFQVVGPGELSILEAGPRAATRRAARLLATSTAEYNAQSGRQSNTAVDEAAAAAADGVVVSGKGVGTLLAVEPRKGDAVVFFPMARHVGAKGEACPQAWHAGAAVGGGGKWALQVFDELPEDVVGEDAVAAFLETHIPPILKGRGDGGGGGGLGGGGRAAGAAGAAGAADQ